MRNLLTQPYPVADSSIQKQLMRAAAIGVFVGLFLLLFQPFGLNLWETPYKTLKIAGFGLISFLISFGHFTFWIRLFPGLFRETTWTVGKEIIYILINILLIAIANRYYLAMLNDELTDLHSLRWMTLVTLLIGIFPTAGLVIGNYIIQLKRYSQQAAALLIKPHTHSTKTPKTEQGTTEQVSGASMTLRLTAENEKDTVMVNTPNNLLFIESSDNYCTIYYLKNDEVVHVLIRSSLSRLESQLKLAGRSHQPFVRCHRSYLVNLDQVEQVTGNAQGYKLHLQHGKFQIPVARKYNDTLIAELKA